MSSFFGRIAAYLCVLVLAATRLAAADLVLSEIMAMNANGLVDEDGDHSDWIEIRNDFGATIDLSGWHLSDDISQPQKWAFPGGAILSAGGHLVVRASGKNRAVAGQELHTNFKLAGDGGIVMLTPGSGPWQGDAMPYGLQFDDVAYGYGMLPGTRYTYRDLTCGYLMEASPGALNPVDAVEHPAFPDDRLPQYDVTIKNSDWQSLFNDRWNDYERPCSVRYRAGDVDVSLASCGISPLGNSSRNHDRMSMRLSFNAFVPGQNLLGVEKVRMRGESNDPSSLRSKLVTDMLQGADVPVAQENIAAMVVQIQGGPRFLMAVYQTYEHYDENYLARVFPGARGNLYKCLWPADLTYRAAGDYWNVINYRADGTPRHAYRLAQQGPGQPDDWSDLAAFVDVLNNSSVADFPAQIDKVFDVDLFLRTIAVTALCGHWDDYVFNKNNYNLYHDVRRGKWVYLPIDYDNTLGVDWTGIDWSTRDVMNWGASGMPLAERILSVPAFRERYAWYVSQYANHLLDTLFVSGSLSNIHQSPLPGYTYQGNPVTNAALQDRQIEHYNRDDWTGSGYRGVNYETFVYGFWGVSGDDNLGGNQVKQGIYEYCDQRYNSAMAQLPAVIDPSPVIGDSILRGGAARVGEDLVFETAVRDDGSLSSATWHYRVNGGVWQSAVMTDNGQGNDTAAADGIFTFTLAALPVVSTVEYYVSATDAASQTSYAPWGGANYANVVNVGSALTGLKFSEIHYHPYEPDRVLINEVSINPPYTDTPYEFVEILSTQGAKSLSGLSLVVINGEVGSNPGQVVYARSLDAVTTGSNGLLLVKSSTGGHAAADSATTVLTEPEFSSAGNGIPNGTITIALIDSPVNGITVGNDLDANDDGILELPQYASLKDVVAITDQGAGDVMYGGVVVPSLNTEVPDAIVRHSGRWDDSADDWYYGQIASQSSSKAFDLSAPDHNVPAGAVLTPGALNMPDGHSDTDYEFVEVVNTTTTSMDLSGVSLADGVTFTFPVGTSLAAGQRIVVVENTGAFAARYGAGTNVAGKYSGKLSNSGETLTLLDPAGGWIESISYEDGGAWPESPDGEGFSLVRTDFMTDASNPAAWHDSRDFHGTPSAEESAALPEVAINEVMANSQAGGLEWIELHNASSSIVDISGWWIGDSKNRYFRYKFPVGTQIPAGGHVVVTQDDFHPADEDPRVPHFTLNDYEGETIYLFAPPASGPGPVLCDSFKFSATIAGESVGRLPDGHGQPVPMSAPTPGATNDDARIGPLVIAEVMYHPADGLAVHEFVEIHNPTAAAVDMSGWVLSGGVSHAFAVGQTLAAGDTLVVLSFDPSNALAKAEFEAYFDRTLGPVAGPFTGALDNGGECVRLLMPGIPEPEAPGVVPMLLVDEICYDDAEPWPLAADGGGYSLHRADATLPGTLASAWWASSPTPGADAGVRISVTKQQDAAEYPATDGVFLIHRQTPGTTDLMVSYSLAGNASSGTDYVALPMSATIPAGGTSVEVPVTAINDVLAEGSETVELSLMPQPGQSTAGDGVATLVIVDHPIEAALAAAFGLEAAQLPANTWLADSDDDGMANLLELALGLQPEISGTISPAISHTVADGLTRFRYRMSPQDLGIELAPEWSADLQTWHDATPLPDGTQGGFDWFQVEVPASDPRHFHRLRARRIP